MQLIIDESSRKVARSALAEPANGDPLIVSSPTRARSAREVRGRVGHLIETIRAGRMIRAVRGFYAPDVEVGLGALAPMCGLETRAGRSWSVANPGAQWRRFDVHGVGVNGDTSFVECVLEFESSSGKVLEMEQVAVSQWRDGLIVKECLIPIRTS